MRKITISKMMCAVFGACVAALLISAFLAGCSSSSPGNASDSSTADSESRTKVYIGYWGGTTCDAAQLAAYEFGKYEEQGLDPELVLIDYDTYPAKATKGELDQVSLSPDSFKQLEQGAPITLVNGDHTGCCSFVVAADSDITDVSQLKGKKIGIEALGGASQIIMSVMLGRAGLDYQNDVEWVVYDYTALTPALEKGEIDAFGYWDPVCQQAIDNGQAKLLFRMNSEDPFNQYVCCYEGLATSVVENEPELAKKLDAAWREGIKLCQEQPEEVAKVLVEKGYVGEDVEFTTKCLESYAWWPDPDNAEESFPFWLEQMKEFNVLESGTDVDDMVATKFKNANDL